MNVLINVEDFDEDEKRIFITLLAENVKYKALWYLRSLEQEINKERGMIKIDVMHETTPIFHIDGFSAELGNKIKMILNQVDFSSDLLS